ncbi:SDR family oxidoreductase [Amycolatopsis nalaikhensis]|uniref:SDR family oxidoreductase n=1 Tax=Amycolatopsis nalaikhensis TaxID=715472 RepID=A0ABY8XF97_9PSEU|nr:SDR family oxidoreductase [Amycolatopsis sp. 2-2]WIV54299.1 SDR family oxidoreductase [Amycolatopsis sp. 2-2]
MSLPAPLPAEAASPRRAVVTGADSGIGRAVAVALAGGGLDVGITYHSDADGAEETAAEVRSRGAAAHVRRLDLTELPGAADVVDAFAEDLGGIDVLVNCSGTGSSQRVLDLSYEKWREVLDVDLDGVFLLSQRAARHMIDAGHGGRIITITSVHEHVPRVGAAPYCAAKAGAGALTQVLALELAEHGITVNSVAPGEISTPMTGQTDADPREQERPGIPLGRTGHAAEVAAAVAFLATPAAGYITGTSVAVDGGLLLMGAQAGTAYPGHDWRSP